MGAKFGFRSAHENLKDEFWFLTKLPGNKLHEVKSLILQKNGNHALAKKLITGFKVQYFNGKKWVWYKNSEIIKTHQYQFDSLELERTIEFSPSFLASEIKIVIPVTERTISAQGRYDFLVIPPSESQVVKPKRGMANGKCYCCTSDEVREADPDAKGAIAQLDASITMQSELGDKWSNPLLNSDFGFHNSEDAKKDKKDFWIEVEMKKTCQVQQIVIQKRGDYDSYKCDAVMQKDIINKFRIDYKDGTWKNYKDGLLLETGQELEDTANIERKIYIDEQFSATKVRVYFPAGEQTGAYMSGRLDVVCVEQEEDQDETEDGTGEKDDNKNSCAGKAILDYDSTSEQSSRYDESWATSKNIFLDSKRGFMSKGSDYKNDFWISVKFPGNQHFLVSSMILKKITHSCCTKRTLNGFKLQYLIDGEWKNYNDGAVV